MVDGSGLKHTLERRVFELAKSQLGGEIPHFKKPLSPWRVDRLGLAIAANEVRNEITAGDLMMEF